MVGIIFFFVCFSWHLWFVILCGYVHMVVVVVVVVFIYMLDTVGLRVVFYIWFISWWLWFVFLYMLVGIIHGFCAHVLCVIFFICYICEIYVQNVCDSVKLIKFEVLFWHMQLNQFVLYYCCYFLCVKCSSLSPIRCGRFFFLCVFLNVMDFIERKNTKNIHFKKK